MGQTGLEMRRQAGERVAREASDIDKRVIRQGGQDGDCSVDSPSYIQL